ncbi:MAG: competence/damage-inducible protein A [Drouetiella hepatica Uher 2000/2452]|jgi:nicotinamide-nucleotide amidase|uniref:CinA-like protein n=1 Tax=Drouetiella hepatica Uher 2000/2452 TaxID=904376 RepID=A0A951QDU4_9CYAN|nr:competence/damage-inducible protein A [Drouetiella hepatica Uher 2000/2452]
MSEVDQNETSQSAEIISVGTELLLGEILNSNAQFLAQELADLGISHYYQTVVGDNVLRLQKAIAIACERSSLLIFTGGLGPTPDDLTTATLADFFGATLVERPEVLQDIAEKLTRRGRSMALSNRKQALLPEGAAILPNPTGTAPGVIWQPRTGVTILTFPGVPSEMKAMWRQTAVPYLRRQGWSQGAIYSRTLRFWGIGESTLAEKASAQIQLKNPTVAPYAGRGEVRLRISTKAATESEALQLIAPVEQQLRDIGGLDCYGTDDDTLAAVVGDRLKNSQQTVSVAESCTGGGLGSLLTAIPGSSAYFWGGIISYDNRVKVNLLGVDANVLAQQGAVSAEVACQMAVGVRDRLGTTWGLSITGIAGPDGGTDTKPVGLVYIGLASPDSVESFQYQFGTFRGRETVRELSAYTALDLLRRKLILATATP